MEIKKQKFKAFTGEQPSIGPDDYAIVFRDGVTEGYWPSVDHQPIPYQGLLMGLALYLLADSITVKLGFMGMDNSLTSYLSKKGGDTDCQEI